MVTFCPFVVAGDCVRCPDCGFSICKVKLPVRRACPGKPFAKRRGLGDMVKAGLSAIGITSERVQAVTGRPCGCAKRQERLNALGRRIGIG